MKTKSCIFLILLTLFLFASGCEPDEPLEITLIARPEEGGRVEGGGLFERISEISVSAIPSEGYRFVSWTEDDQILTTNANYTFTVFHSRVLIANFEQIVYPEPDYGEMTDPRDDRTYKTIRIGSQLWMAENLNYSIQNSWCYDETDDNCLLYGRLYDWENATDACPEGWHLPSDVEWDLLADYLGGESIAGGRMKAAGTLQGGTGLWESPNTSGVNSSGFSGLPGGRRYPGGEFYGIGIDGYWWCSNDNGVDFSYFRVLRYFNAEIHRGIAHKIYAGSVRCIKN